MAATAVSPTSALPPSQPNFNTKPSSLPPLITSTNTVRRTNSQRPPSSFNKRLSTFSSASRISNTLDSRPGSHVFPIFHSSLPYALVQDFAYPVNHPLHYGPPPMPSNQSTPVSEYRRLSDPAVSSWEEVRGPWSAGPPWISENSSSSTREQLPAMKYGDGPPYSEDEDLHSPVVTTSRHKKHKSSYGERGRSPGAAATDQGISLESASRGHIPGPSLDGPGEAIVRDLSEHYRPRHRDSNFAKPLERERRTSNVPEDVSEDEHSGVEDDSDDTRFSKDYSFTIASPDEEMHGKAVALFDFANEHQNELPLKEGQIILVSYRHGQGWLVAEDLITGESGLVPEEYVRLVRDIEGGLNSLGAVDFEDVDANDLLTPASADSQTETTPVANNHEFAQQPGSTSAIADRHPPVQSSFSTSSKDLDPYPLPKRSEEPGSATPTEE